MTSEIEAFSDDLQLQVQTASSAIGGSKHEHFTNFVISKLAEFDEVIDLQPMHYEFVGAKGKKYRIDGLSWDDLDDSIVALVVDFSDGVDAIQIITQGEISALHDSLVSFLELSLDDSSLSKLESSSAAAQAAYDIRSRISVASKFKLYIVSNRKLSTRAKAIPSVNIGLLRTETQLWDLVRLCESSFSKKTREDIEIELSQFGKNGLNALEFKSGDDLGLVTYLVILSGDLLAQIYDRFGSRLLEGNVRSFLSLRGSVNKGIRNSILNNPDKFLLFNNGLTATASEVTAKFDGNGTATIEKIKGLQIVNGGQTTATLYQFSRFEKELRENLSQVSVQMKLVVVPESDDELVPLIARYANTQNKISETDFFANSPFHRRMEEISRRLIANPRSGELTSTRWFYERSRGSYLNETLRLSSQAAIKKFQKEYPKQQVIDKVLLAKLFNTWAQKPHLVSRGNQKNFSEFANSVADKYLEESGKAQFADDFYKRIVCIALIWDVAYRAVRTAAWYEKGYLANIVSYSISWFSHWLGGDEMDLDWTLMWKLQETPASFTELFRLIGQEMQKVLTDPTRPQQNVTEWAKTEACWVKAKQTQINIPSELRSGLVKISSEMKKEIRNNEKANGQVLSELEAIKQVIDLGVDYFDKLNASDRVTLSQKEISIINVFRRDRVVTGPQASVLLAAKKRAIDNGFSVNQ